MPGPVIYLVRSWPRLSQTFIVNEVLAVERRGVELAVFAMVRSGEKVVQPQVANVRAPVRYLEDRGPRRQRLAEHATVFAAAPVRYLRAGMFALRHRGLSAGYATTTTFGCFRQAVQVAATVVRLRRSGTAPEHLHAHFAHDPALVALLVRRLTRLPYSFTAHARDLVQIPPENLRARAVEATALVTCCQANADYIATAVPTCPTPVRVVHHGVELNRFAPPPTRPLRTVAKLVSVGRLVEKKGFADLLQALKGVKASGQEFSCDVYGEGPLLPRLVELRDSLDLTTEVSFRGEQDRDAIIAALRDADIFVLTPVVTSDGDRDGIPNVLVEAMACGLPVVTTSAGGIAELVHHGVNGMLTTPGDVADIEAQLAAVLDSQAVRREMGAAARRTVEADYDVDAAAEELELIFFARRREEEGSR